MGESIWANITSQVVVNNVHEAKAIFHELENVNLALCLRDNGTYRFVSNYAEAVEFYSNVGSNVFDVPLYIMKRKTIIDPEKVVSKKSTPMKVKRRIISEESYKDVLVVKEVMFHKICSLERKLRKANKTITYLTNTVNKFKKLFKK